MAVGSGVAVLIGGGVGVFFVEGVSGEGVGAVTTGAISSLGMGGRFFLYSGILFIYLPFSSSHFASSFFFSSCHTSISFFFSSSHLSISASLESIQSSLFSAEEERFDII